jgi:flagellar protein FlhE
LLIDKRLSKLMLSFAIRPFISGSIYMKNFNRLNGIAVAASFSFAATMLSTQAVAGSSNSSVRLPTLHSKNYVYTAHFTNNGLQAGQSIRSVSWNWNVHGWPRGLEVYLCQGPAACIDVSRQRAGSTNNFTRFKPFHYKMKVSHPGTVPVAGLLGTLTVNW